MADIIGPNGETIDLRSPHRGMTPEQLKFIAQNAPRLGELPVDATHASRSQRQLIALQQGLFKMSQDNYQLWVLLAAMLERCGEPQTFARNELAEFVDPKTWPSVNADDAGGLVVSFRKEKQIDG